MNKLALVSIAAIAASLPALASAQQQTVSPPVPWEEVPAARLNVPAAPPPSPGVTWQQRAPRTQAPVQLPDTAARAATHQNGGPVALVRQAKRGSHGGGMRHMRPGGGMKHMRPGGGGMKHMRPGGGMHHARPGGMKHVRPGGGMHHVGPGGKNWRPGGKHWRPGGHGPIVKPMRPGGHHAGGGHGKRFDHFRRIHRGGRVNQFWWGPQFHIQNWGLYGFPQPLHNDWRWVRYYDDAYLIDRDGRVHDERYGLDWDRYGERWDYDDLGIPTYRDDYDDSYGDDYAEEDYGDEGYAEGWDEEEAPVYEDRREYGHGGGYGHGGYATGGGCTVTYSFDSRHPVPPPPPPPCASGHGYGYGGAVVVTETTVTTAPVVTEHVVYEDVVVREKVRKHKPKRKYHKRHAPPPPPPPYDGERG